MRTVFNRNHSQTIDMGSRKIRESNVLGTVSTLLIPEELMIDIVSKFPTIERKNGDPALDMRTGMKTLLNKYRAFFAMGFLPFTEKAKLTFQEEGRNLQEVKFRPDEADWAELGIIAYGLGVSRCWLFSFMLELERLGFEDILRIPGLTDVVATPAVSRPQQILRISGRRRLFRRILHFRI